MVSSILRAFTRKSFAAAKVEDVLGLDKKRVLQRLRNRGPNRNLDNNGDVTRSLRPSVVIVGGRLFDQFNSQVRVRWQ